MTREAKIGLMMVAVLVGVFGFLVYKRVHQPANLRAEQEIVDNSSERIPEPNDNVDLTEFEIPPKVQEQLETPQFARKTKKVEQDLKRTVTDIEDLAEEAVEEVAREVKPFIRGQDRREKPKLPRDLSADDEEFAQSTKSRKSSNPTLDIPLPDVNDSAFDDVSEEPPPRQVVDRRDRGRTDPFEKKPSKEAPIEFEKPDIRQINHETELEDLPEATEPATTDDQTVEQSSRETDLSNQDFDLPRESNRRAEFAPRERRPAASQTLSDDNAPRDFGGPKTIPVEGPTYTVQPNDNFWSISRKRYGAGRYYLALAIHNRQTISDPKMMKPGMVIATPDAAVLERMYGDSIPKPAPIESANPVTTTQSRKSPVSAPAGYFVSDNGDPMYRIGQNDTLTDIAKTHLGRSSRWVQILEMNRNVLRDGNELKVGTVLRLPADASRVRIVGTTNQFR